MIDVLSSMSSATLRHYQHALGNVQSVMVLQCVSPWLAGQDGAGAPHTSLSSTLDASTIQQELQAATEQQEALQQEQADSNSSEHNPISRLQWREGLCGLSLLPLDLLELPLTVTPTGQPCLVRLFALY